MAKLARNRIMYFGAQKDGAIAENATATVDNTDLKGLVTVDKAKFGTWCSKDSGEYTIIYDANKGKWFWNSAEVNLTEAGVTIGGSATPANNDAIVVVYTAARSAWEALGKDNDDLSKELNAETETTANVLGETTFTHSGFEPEVSLDPYYIDPARKLYAWLRDIALDEKYDEASCVGLFAECYFETANPEKKIMTGKANVRKAWYIPQSIGGDTAGAAIPVNITPFGAATKYYVSYNMETNEPTFTKVNDTTATTGGEG